MPSVEEGGGALIKYAIMDQVESKEFLELDVFPKLEDALTDLLDFKGVLVLLQNEIWIKGVQFLTHSVQFQTPFLSLEAKDRTS